MPSDVAVAGQDITLGWIPAVLEIAMVVALVIGVFKLFDDMRFSNFFKEPRTLGELLGAIAAYCGVLAAITCQFALLIIVLLDIGLGSTQPVLSSGRTLGALSWLTWKSSDAIPVLHAPTTLGWTLTSEFTDEWSASLLLTFEVAALSVIVLVLPGLVLSYSRRVSHSSPVAGLLSSGFRMVEDLRTGHARLDEVEELLLERMRRGDHIPTRSFLPASGMWDVEPWIKSSQRDFEDVGRLFGPGVVCDAGRAALATLEVRSKLIKRIQPLSALAYPASVDGPSGGQQISGALGRVLSRVPTGVVDASNLLEAKAVAVTAMNAFIESVNEALVAAAAQYP